MKSGAWYRYRWSTPGRLHANVSPHMRRRPSAGPERSPAWASSAYAGGRNRQPSSADPVPRVEETLLDTYVVVTPLKRTSAAGFKKTG